MSGKNGAVERTITTRQIVIALVTTVGAILAAAVPGFWAFMRDRATQDQARESRIVAEESKVQGEVVYELLADEVSDLKGSVSEMQQVVDKLRDTQNQLIGHLRATHPTSASRRGPAGRSPGSSAVSLEPEKPAQGGNRAAPAPKKKPSAQLKTPKELDDMVQQRLQPRIKGF